MGAPSSYESSVIAILKKENIPFVREKTFKDLKKGKYRFDFYIPDYKGRSFLIEVDSELHYSYIKFFHKTPQGFTQSRGRDRDKNRFALRHRIPLYRIPHDEIQNIKSISDILSVKYLVIDAYHNDYVANRRKANEKIDKR